MCSSGKRIIPGANGGLVGWVRYLLQQGDWYAKSLTHCCDGVALHVTKWLFRF